MGNEVDNLTTKQELAIVALLRESTVANAAIACEASERTIYRWLAESASGRRNCVQRHVRLYWHIAVIDGTRWRNLTLGKRS